MGGWGDVVAGARQMELGRGLGDVMAGALRGLEGGTRGCSKAGVAFSLVPRLFFGEGKEPGIHAMHTQNGKRCLCVMHMCRYYTCASWTYQFVKVHIP